MLQNEGERMNKNFNVYNGYILCNGALYWDVPISLAKQIDNNVIITSMPAVMGESTYSSICFTNEAAINTFLKRMRNNDGSLNSN